ncbi:MAG TPA: DUF502 domain-containing protein [Gammaproteobacteria bacterium]|nr:DUF502 domain-containing protein [Gammaproteobacteria bacterium]
MPKPPAARPLARFQRYFLAGVLTVIPLWITWVVFDFTLRQLSNVGMPWVRAVSGPLQDSYPSIAHWLLAPWFQSGLAVVLTLLGLSLLGWIATRVIGKRVIGAVDSLMNRIPLVHTIYGSTKKLIAALQQKPENVQRVVLIEFPSPQMKTIGFVTRVMKDSRTGRELAAVYVPTTPNPTSGYLEIVPVERLVSTNWTMDEAMSFIISGGAVAPESVHYDAPAPDITAPAPSPSE